MTLNDVHIFKKKVISVRAGRKHLPLLMQHQGTKTKPCKYETRNFRSYPKQYNVLGKEPAHWMIGLGEHT
jgi:hypothetical protein